ncbi:MAG: DUF116 domain-containing protein [Candidatus Diapherotrites archaeon]|nr:DUF116 domain-containing protein [Candidatus Diapherotrites archaeon]
MADKIYEKIRFAVGRAADVGAHLSAATAAEAIGKTLGLGDTLIQFTHVELRNAAYEPAFKKVPYSERVLFLPHCSRNIKCCKAAQNGEGYECKNCGACNIDKAIKIAQELGYGHTFIVPGGSMLKKIILKYKPKAVVGVSCFHEAILGFEEMKGTGVTPQSVLLLNDGCKDTTINLHLLRQKMAMIDDTINKENPKVISRKKPKQR